MSIVGQEPVLFNVSIRDNIAYGLEDVSEEEIIEAARLANIHSFVVSLPKVNFIFYNLQPIYPNLLI
jgi:ABC-type multidrug transport system fused ATPase/permease subunit